MSHENKLSEIDQTDLNTLFGQPANAADTTASVETIEQDRALSTDSGVLRIQSGASSDSPDQKGWVANAKAVLAEELGMASSELEHLETREQVQSFAAEKAEQLRTLSPLAIISHSVASTIEEPDFSTVTAVSAGIGLLNPLIFTGVVSPPALLTVTAAGAGFYLAARAVEAFVHRGEGVDELRALAA